MVNRHPVTCRAQARASMLVSSRDVATSGRAHALRRKAGKPTLPVWFVYFGKGKAQAETHAAAAKSYRKHGRNLLDGRRVQEWQRPAAADIGGVAGKSAAKNLGR